VKKKENFFFHLKLSISVHPRNSSLDMCRNHLLQSNTLIYIKSDSSPRQPVTGSTVCRLVLGKFVPRSSVDPPWVKSCDLSGDAEKLISVKVT
jgi:hypothetical protein